MPGIVTHYGLHRDDDHIAYLHQGKMQANFIGLEGGSPFKVEPINSRPCPHSIDPALPSPPEKAWTRFCSLNGDPLFRECIPRIPRGSRAPLTFIVDTGFGLNAYIAELVRTWAPAGVGARPIWQCRRDAIFREMQITNLAPLILTQARVEDNGLLYEIIDAAAYSPRRVLVTGSANMVVPAPAKRKVSRLAELISLPELRSLPLEQCGVEYIRQLARNQVVCSPMT